MDNSDGVSNATHLDNDYLPKEEQSRIQLDTMPLIYAIQYFVL